MIMSKSKVIVVLARRLAQCYINIECAKKDKSKYGKEWFDDYRCGQQSIIVTILSISRDLGVLNKVNDEADYIFDDYVERGAE